MPYDADYVYAFNKGYEAGLRRAAEIANDLRGVSIAGRDIYAAILAEIGK